MKGKDKGMYSGMQEWVSPDFSAAVRSVECPDNRMRWDLFWNQERVTNRVACSYKVRGVGLGKDKGYFWKRGAGYLTRCCVVPIIEKYKECVVRLA